MKSELISACCAVLEPPNIFRQEFSFFAFFEQTSHIYAFLRLTRNTPNFTDPSDDPLNT